MVRRHRESYGPPVNASRRSKWRSQGDAYDVTVYVIEIIDITMLKTEIIYDHLFIVGVGRGYILQHGLDASFALVYSNLFIFTEKTKTKEEIKVEILQFHSKKQKEMHALETEHIKERHKLEMEILELKKKKKMLEIDKITMSNIRSGQSLVG